MAPCPWGLARPVTAGEPRPGAILHPGGPTGRPGPGDAQPTTARRRMGRWEAIRTFTRKVSALLHSLRPDQTRGDQFPDRMTARSPGRLHPAVGCSVTGTATSRVGPPIARPCPASHPAGTSVVVDVAVPSPDRQATAGFDVSLGVGADARRAIAAPGGVGLETLLGAPPVHAAVASSSATRTANRPITKAGDLLTTSSTSTRSVGARWCVLAHSVRTASRQGGPLGAPVSQPSATSALVTHPREGSYWPTRAGPLRRRIRTWSGAPTNSSPT